MSYIFTVRETDDDIWEPALAVGQLFMGGVEALSGRILRMPSGLDDISGDWVMVDPVAYGAFVDAALKCRGRTGHSEFITLLDGLMPVMIMLADKAGAPVTPTTHVERAYLEWAGDEDRVLCGHVWGKRDGSVFVGKTGVIHP
ncbi:DUF6086 family protein [Streptomyces phaeofaciens]|uniref:DUF6086 family protein n=1 Tax=Streptomyces phaeofaciens TaxID=68254 RepID=UPI0036C1371A